MKPQRTFKPAPVISDPPRHGAFNHRATLTEAKVMVIRECLKNGERVCEIARKIGATSGAISEIKRGRTWAYLGPI